MKLGNFSLLFKELKSASCEFFINNPQLNKIPILDDTEKGAVGEFIKEGVQLTVN